MIFAIKETRWVPLPAAGEKHFSHCLENRLCPACGELLGENDTTQRGVHLRCYYATYRAVVAGKTTFEERQRQGKIGPPGRPGRKKTNPVSIELE